MTIVEFLTARLDEEEASAQAVVDIGGLGDWEDLPVAELDGRRALTGGSFIFAVMDPVPEGPACADHIARHDPARVLRETTAKRAILALHEPNGDYCSTCLESESDLYGAEYEEAPCLNVRHLAAVYSDHPDYDPEWSPA